MKFLQPGDSVVSLRFKFQEMPGRYEEAESASDKLTFDTVGEIQDAMANLFESGEAPFGLQERILDLDAIRAKGDYTQADMVNQLASFQNSLNGTLAANGEYPDIADFMSALQEYMNQAADDLGEFKEEANALRGEVEHYAERVAIGADARGEMAELAELVLASESGDQIKATEIGLKNDVERQATTSREQVAIASTVRELPQDLGAALASLDEETAATFGPSAMSNFNPDQFA
jgi:hypothetical protein